MNPLFIPGKNKTIEQNSHTRSSRIGTRFGHRLSYGLLASVGLVLTVGGAYCLPSAPVDKDRTAILRAFTSADELQGFFVEQANHRTNSQRQNGLGWLFGTTMMMNAVDAGDSAGSESTDDYSTTNIQELGVDESDIVKNDGTHIYWLKNNTIHVIAATPPDQMAEVATIELAVRGDSLYLSGSTLIALSGRYGYAYTWGSPAWDATDNGEEDDPDDEGNSPTATFSHRPGFDGGQVTVTFIDVSDPTQPVIDATVDFESDLVTSRLIDDQLHIVMTTHPCLPDSPVLENLEAMTLDDWLPDYQVATAGQVVRSGDIINWPQAFRPEVADGYAITTVVTLNIADPTGPFESTAVTADTGTIYASLNALYICDVEYDWDWNEYRIDTMIHKLAFTDEGTEYAASGLVPGRPLNQYSLGEHEGYLRIATTQEGIGSSDNRSANGVYVLEEADAALSIVGQLENLGLDEEIYAARFIGERGFLVTFQRIDPLFTLDLSDPTNPQVMGELKVPGYSDHIQLLDENHLLTIGKDAEEAGDWGAWVQGVQLSIFDVTDMENPTLAHKEIIGTRGTNSEANYNPKAFNYHPATGALALPIELYTGDEGGPVYGDYTFTGLLVYHVTVEDGFTELGRISTVPDDQPSAHCWWGYYGSTRGIFIGDTVYAVSDLGVKAAPLDDVSTLTSEVAFNDTPNQYCGWVDPLILPEMDEGLR